MLGCTPFFQERAYLRALSLEKMQISIDFGAPTISRSRSLFSNIKTTKTHKINLTDKSANATKAPTLQTKLKHGRHHQSAHHMWPHSPIIKSTNMERIILVQKQNVWLSNGQHNHHYNNESIQNNKHEEARQEDMTVSTCNITLQSRHTPKRQMDLVLYADV